MGGNGLFSVSMEALSKNLSFLESSHRIIANNITVLTFTRYGNLTKVVRINMTTQKSTVSGRLLNASLVSEANLRN